jgi:hypothetical protein
MTREIHKAARKAPPKPVNTRIRLLKNAGSNIIDASFEYYFITRTASPLRA